MEIEDESDEQYALRTIGLWARYGFFSEAEMHRLLEDILWEGADVAMLVAEIARQVALTHEESLAWPAETDCDRIDAAFVALHGRGICALHNTGFTMSDGHANTRDFAAARRARYHGYCFYHGQDVERAIEGQGLWIAFGDLRDSTRQGVEVGKAVAAALTDAGLHVDWNGSIDQRIDLPGIDWKRRAPPPPFPPADPPGPWWRFWR